jgi:hypothetical protein
VLATGSTVLAATAPGSAYLRSYICHPALDSGQRVVSVTAVMPTINGVQRLAMRFELESRASGAMAPVRGGDLGRWISPQPLTLGQRAGDVWIVRHPVTGVPVPADYRFRVTFRWIGADGRTLAEVVRTGPSCWQPDMRPDLLVRSIAVKPVAANGGPDRYVAVVSNAGLTTATAVQVLFRPGGGAPSQTVTVPRLRPHASRTEMFIGPACTAASAPTIIVDPADRVDDLDRANNSLTATCPPPSGG